MSRSRTGQAQEEDHVPRLALCTIGHSPQRLCSLEGRTGELRRPGSVKLLPSKGSHSAVGNDVYIKRLVNVKSLVGY